MDPHRIYEYLTLARARVFDRVATLSAAQQAHVFPIGLGSLGATLTHTMMAEWFYIRRMARAAVPAYKEWPHRYEAPPGFEVIRPFWEELAGETRRVMREVRDWEAPISYVAMLDDGEAGPARTITATAADIFTQLATHEVHHRAQAMMMLRQLGAPVEDLDFSAMTYARR
ncbi:MAG TPA: DinB family protein [Phycisphaerales bacterium]|nr:DinB family protein [Phycisphaerales bacterium]